MSFGVRVELHFLLATYRSSSTLVTWTQLPQFPHLDNGNCRDCLRGASVSCLLAVSANPRDFLPSLLLQNTASPSLPPPIPVGQVVRMNECPRLTAEARLSLPRWPGNAAGPRELRCGAGRAGA